MENNHVHSFKDTVVPPTCKDAGYTLHRCECGYEHKDNFVPHGNHKFVVFEQTDPTCLGNGVQRLRCTSCGVTGTRALPPTGHAWGKWNAVTMPTCTDDGLQNRACARCGAMQKQAIKAIGHNLVNKQKSKSHKGCFSYFCKNCGQTVIKKSKAGKVVALTVILTLLAVAFIVLGIIFIPMLLP